MAHSDRSEELNSNLENGSCNSNEGTNLESIENVVKVRKPYVVTKQREKWSEEEHERFLEAIKLYGRGWRQIEEHIGTKTAVQIRSHAQKFFSKVAREADNSSSGPVIIPPPRPKRKPLHPYPRKSKSPSSNLPALEQGTKSPTSVLSAYALEDQINRCSSPNSCISDIQSIGGKNDNATSKQSHRDDSIIGSRPISSITLFGKVVLVAEESHKQTSFKEEEDDDLQSMIMKGKENHYWGIKKYSLHVDTDLSLGVTSCTGSNMFGSVTDVPCRPLSSVNGFRPYKRCLSEREVTSSLSLVASEEEDKSQRRARVCS